MKRTSMTLGWLVVAAALTIGMTACSGEDSVIEEPTQQQPTQQATAIHVTVGAGISDGATTRSLVVRDGSKRVLTFTLPVGELGDADYSPGDRLYIYGEIERNVRTMGGLLTIKSISNDGLSATFEGDLTVWVNENGSWKVDDTGWSATQEGDPMTWYGTNSINAWLIPAAMAADADIYKFSDNGYLDFYIEYSLVTGSGNLANKLMESAIKIHGFYDKTERCFELECKGTIFNCTFSGLEAKTEYHVRFGRANDEGSYNSNGFDQTFNRTYQQTVTTDGDGTARFAFSNDHAHMGGYYGIQLCEDEGFNSNVFSCIFGLKIFEVKVYNVRRHWTGTEFIVEHIYNDPQGNEILDSGVNEWLWNNRFTQADIDNLGSDAEATEKLYECWLYNCNFTVEGAGCNSVSVTGTTSEGGYVKTATVQLTRTAPLGAINGYLYLYADDSRIPDESVEFFENNDPTFATAPNDGEVTQTATGTFNVSIRATTITAEITPLIIDNGEEP